MLRARRIWVTAAAVLAVVGGSPGWAQAEPSPRSEVAAQQLPSGWSFTGEGAERQLVWRSGRPVPMGDARVEFYAGDRLLGRPEAAKDGRTFRLPLEDALSARGLQGTKGLADLQVRAGGRRLDAAGPAAAPEERRAAITPPALAPANPVDPGKPGSYRTVSGEYTLDSVRLPGFPVPVEMKAVVVAPTGATGRRPLALFLHGRHSTCYKPGTDEISGAWPCPAGEKQIPSYRGYLRDQKLLASQGYVTVSISANGINAQDAEAEDAGAQARSSLVRQHLARWADWAANRPSAPAVVRNAPVADLSRVLLVGHSRGGEGVNRAAMDSLYRPPADQDGYGGPVRWNIRGTVLIGPTIFGQNPVADVPSVTILPGCDGDVSDLQGELALDGTRGISRGTALHSAVYVIGANHNYFNTEWTPGQAQAPADDDFWSDPDAKDPVCDVGARTRLTADQQHKAGASYIAAAARLFVAGDDRVRPLLDGSGRRAPSADPARVLTHAVGGNRAAGILPDGAVTVQGGGGRLCSAVDDRASVRCLAADSGGESPHFAGWMTRREVGRRAVTFKWSQPGTAVHVRPERPVSLGGAKGLALRVVVPPNTTGTQLDVSVTDTAGKRATLGRVRVDGLPGSNRTASYWAREVRVPLSAAASAGVDLRKIRSVDLTPRSRSGQAWLIDAWSWRPGTPAMRPAALPRVDIGRLTVKEGDSGSRTYRVPVRVAGQGGGSGAVRVYVQNPGSETVTNRLVTVRPGEQSIDVPVTVKGDTRYDYDAWQFVFVKAVRGAVIGSYTGGVTALNDDPRPTVTVAPVADRVTEGQRLTWRATLSAPSGTDMSAILEVVPVGGGAELSTTDVDPAWLDEVSGESPLPERALSSIEGLYLWVSIPPGEVSAELSIPTVADSVVEGEESVRVRVTDFDEGTGEPVPGPEFTGTVLDSL
uniref:Secreted protein n=1 Tax=Streptomyces sp. NBC_00093 TaxID=2975649 RepID=A0AAU1ZT84_9ACTN